MQDGVRTDDQKDETQVENYVAQCYIENPYLIGGKMLVSVCICLTCGERHSPYDVPVTEGGRSPDHLSDEG